MFDHIGLHVSNFTASVAFYQRTLASLGHALGSHDDTSYAGFGPPGASALWLHAHAGAQGGTHLAFRAATRAQVDQFHRDGLAAGARDNGAPGIRSAYGPHYYAAFLIDPDGNNIEAVCLEAS